MFCEMNTDYFTSLICEFYLPFLEFISLYMVVTSLLACHWQLIWIADTFTSINVHLRCSFTSTGDL